MNNRLRAIRDSLGLSRSEFGERIGVSGDVINNLERGRVGIKNHMFKLICSEFGVNENWLLSGNGEMFKPLPGDMLDSLIKTYDLPNEVRIIAEKFINLSPAERTVVINYVKSVATAIVAEQEAPDHRDIRIQKTG